MTDTFPKAEQVRIRALRAMSPSKRLSMALGWSQSVREISNAGLRRQFPNYTARELHRQMAIRILGDELATKAYRPPKATLAQI